MHTNLTAYQHTEDMENYPTPEILKEYREHLLKKSEGQRDFIRSLFPEKIKVLEVCSGNSRLLYSLSLTGCLGLGVGVEVSRSRYNFAELWRKDIDITNVFNLCGDIMRFGTTDTFDLVLIMSNAFMYFDPIDETYPEKLLRKFHSWLKDDGKLIMEVRDYREEIKIKEIYKQLPESDPFHRLHTRYMYHSETKCLELDNTFTRRDGIKCKTNEMLRVYDIDEIKMLLRKCGFSKIDISPNEIAIDPADDKVLVVADK